jgi:hypothetical protein
MGSPTITYRAAGPWGAGKGADLDAGEIDNNFYSIAQSIQDLIDNPPTPNNISSIEVINNNQLLITLDDYRTFGPFDLPIASFSDRGEWAAVTLYNYGDIFTHLSSLYMALQEHTSAASFNASDGNMAGPYYRLLFSAANLMLEWTEEWLPSHAYTPFQLFQVPDVGVFFTLVAHTSATTFDPLAVDDSGNDLYQKVFQAIESEIARIQAQFPGQSPSDGSVMMSYIQDDDRDLLLEAGLVDSFAHLEVAVTGILEYTLSYSGATIATLTFNPGDLLDGEGGQYATIAMAADALIHNGELLRLKSPTHADTTARFLSVAIKGTFQAVTS